MIRIRIMIRIMLRLVRAIMITVTEADQLAEQLWGNFDCGGKLPNKRIT